MACSRATVPTAIGWFREWSLVIWRSERDAPLVGSVRTTPLDPHKQRGRADVLSSRDGGLGDSGATLIARWPGMSSPVGGEISLSLPAEPASCALARRAVRAFCRTHRLAHLCDDAELLTSELIANAVHHAHAPVGLTAQCSDASVTVQVTDDDSRAILPPATPASELAERGRGLFVVAEVAGDWGTSQQGDTKSVWFRLP
jgi:anti-sigma regulatory factor (Ser/Thr protein kinase)